MLVRPTELPANCRPRFSASSLTSFVYGGDLRAAKGLSSARFSSWAREISRSDDLIDEKSGSFSRDPLILLPCAPWYLRPEAFRSRSAL